MCGESDPNHPRMPLPHPSFSPYGMPQPLAFLNGQITEASDISLAVTDAGFVLGVTVAEQLRTFGGELFRLDQHLQRLERSLEIIGVDPGMSCSQFAESAMSLVAHNHTLIDAGDDLGLCIFVTPGPYGTFASEGDSKPTVGMHTYRLPYHLWCEKYQQGQALVVSQIKQVPAECWSPELKCRSRMHYYLADREANLAAPGARALLLDIDGFVTEASTASVVIYRSDEGFIAPPPEKILSGVSLSVMLELTQQLGERFSHRDLRPSEVAKADEVFLCSTTSCIVPVCSLNQKPIAGGKPGSMFRKLLAAWSDMVGVDIRAQSLRFG